MTNILKSFKKVILCEKIAKFNPYHDKLGRFTSADGASFMTITTKNPSKQHMADLAINRAKKKAKKEEIFKKVDALIFATDKEKSELKTFFEGLAKEISGEDRLGISEESALEKMVSLSCFNPRRRPSDVMDWAYAEKDSIINKAISSYCEDKLGVKCIQNHKVDNKLILDFIDGAAWTKKNIGDASTLTYVSDSDLGGAFAANCSLSNGKCFMAVDMSVYEPGSSFIDGFAEFGKDKNYHPKNFCSQQIGAHEYAHAIEHSVYHNIFGEQSGVDERIVSNVVLERAIANTGKNDVKSISDGAVVNSSEAFAESIADVYSNGKSASELSREVFRIATEEMDDICAELEQRK